MTVNVRAGNGFTLVGGTSTGQTVADNCDVRAHLPELATTTTGTSAFGAGSERLRRHAGEPVLPCRVRRPHAVARALSSYVVPKVDVQLVGDVPEQAGGDAGGQLRGAERGRRAVARAESLGQRAERDGEPGRAGHDVRRSHQPARLRACAKILKFGRSRTLVGVDVYNALNSSAVLTYNNAFVPGGTWLQPLTILTPRFFKFTAEVTSRSHAQLGRIACRRADGCVAVAVGAAGARWCRALSRPRRTARSRCSSCTRRDGTRRSPSSASASCRGSSRAGCGGPLDYYSEYIDRARFPDPDYQAGFRDFLRLKYTGYRFDLVIAMQDIALEFVGEQPERALSRHSGRLLRELLRATTSQNSTGIVAPTDLRRHARSGCGAAAGRPPRLRRQRRVNARQGVRSAGAGTAPAVRILDSRSPTCPACRRGISRPGWRRCRRNSIVYYLLVDRDGAGENFHPLEYLDRVTAVANAPVYCWVDSAMDHGIVGGSLTVRRPRPRDSVTWPFGCCAASGPTASRCRLPI